MPATAYRAGLNKYENVPRLLKSVNRTESRHQASIASRTQRKPPGVQEQDESFILAEPLSDDDDDTNRASPSSCSDKEEVGRGDILPTNFKKRGSLSKRVTQVNADDDGFEPIRDSISVTDSISQTKAPLRRSKRCESESTTKISKKTRLESSYEATELNMFKIAPSKSRLKNIRKYGSSQSRSQESRTELSNGDSSPKAVFEKHLLVQLDMPESPEKTFKPIEQVMSLQPETEAERTFITVEIPGSSPESSLDEGPKFKLGMDLSKLPLPDSGSPIFRTPDIMRLLDQSNSLVKDTLDKAPVRPLESGEGFQSQKRIPGMLSITPEVDSTSQAEVAGTNCLEESSCKISSLSPEDSSGVTCPMCGESIDAALLSKYNSGKRMNIRTQTKICRIHKKSSAHKEWAEKGYPSIDWFNFESRLAQHHSYIRNLLDGASKSYYRDVLAEKVRSGKGRTLLQAVSSSDKSMTPGYYGSRGFRAMSENIIEKFSPQLRRIAVTDRLVAARGVIGYVQNVLVPELAVRLICEDMNIGVEEAMQVMRDSVNLGDLLNEEVEDVVTWREGEDTI